MARVIVIQIINVIRNVLYAVKILGLLKIKSKLANFVTLANQKKELVHWNMDIYLKFIGAIKMIIIVQKSVKQMVVIINVEYLNLVKILSKTTKKCNKNTFTTVKGLINVNKNVVQKRAKIYVTKIQKINMDKPKTIKMIFIKKYMNAIVKDALCNVNFVGNDVFFQIIFTIGL